MKSAWRDARMQRSYFEGDADAIGRNLCLMSRFLEVLAKERRELPCLRVGSPESKVYQWDTVHTLEILPESLR
jgi:hypothetical protein